MSTPPGAARISPIGAAQEAIEHTRRLLFPFRFERWLALGFLAFLDQCGRGGAGTPPNLGGSYPTGVGEAGGGPSGAEIAAWIGENLWLIVAGAALILTVIVLLVALVLFINCRGIFMYMEAVATGGSAVARPWREHAGRAQSLFAWRFGLAMASLMGVLLILTLGALAALGYSRGQLAGVTTGLALVVVLLPALIVVVFGTALASVLLRDFVAPLQWRLGLSCGDAVDRALGMIRAEPLAFAVYVALKVAFGIGVAAVTLVAGCLTCCLGFLPVVGQTLLQPLFHFERAWSLFLLRQLGCDVFPAA